ncbi:hypothetical protein CH305_01515 [Rhodococcus sp. 15-649-2-2]|nr:hypothetical protein CH305_01515 [Rhodococcus sp. 15-649-2-2]
MVDLWAPRRDEDLWLAKGPEELNPNRPILTGDVFHLGPIPGVDETESHGSELAMVVSHPCAMRDGPVLKPRVEVVRILQGTPVPGSAWNLHKTKLPLPGLAGMGLTEGNEFYAALDLAGRVPSAKLEVFSRKACLSESGIAALLQRRTWRQTQYVAEHESFMLSNAHVFIEAELHEEWCDELLGELPASVDGERLRSAQLLAEEAVAFDEVLSRPRELAGRKKRTHTCREDLQNISNRSAARTIVRRETKETRKARDRAKHEPEDLTQQESTPGPLPHRPSAADPKGGNDDGAGGVGTTTGEPKTASGADQDFRPPMEFDGIDPNDGADVSETGTS